MAKTTVITQNDEIFTVVLAKQHKFFAGASAKRPAPQSVTAGPEARAESIHASYSSILVYYYAGERVGGGPRHAGDGDGDGGRAGQRAGRRGVRWWSVRC